MSLYDFPNEILIFVGNELDAKSLNALIQSSRFFHTLLSSRLDILALDNKDGMPAICWAAKRGHTPLVRLLLEAKMKANRKDRVAAETALHKAAQGGFVDIAKLLLKAGAKLNKKNILGDNELHMAARGKHDKMVELLLKKGVNVEARNRRREGVLYAAVQGGSEKVVSILVNTEGVCKYQRNVEGDTALHLAIRKGNEKVAKLLIERVFGLDPGRVLRSNNYNGEYGIDIEHLAGGKTVLQEAVISGCNGIVKLLLEKKANIEANGLFSYGIQSCTKPLHMAMTTKDITMVKLLLTKGAEINAKDMDGKTPLHWAVLYRFDMAIDFLLEKGANTRIRDNAEKTPLELAPLIGNAF